jgi:3-oxoacyl-(acyl-carrier-protein) synthase
MNRVVITGMGVLAPNAHGLGDFEQALREGRSGIRHLPRLAELNFSCQVAGVPQGYEELARDYFAPDALLAMNSGMIFTGIAGLDCWRDAGLELPDPVEGPVDWETGAVIGTGVGGVDTLGNVVIPRVNEGKVRRIGSTSVEQTMSSAVSGCLGGLLALGGEVTTNSSACTTGTEAVIQAFWHLQAGRARRMLAGGAEGASEYTWGGFDAMRVLARGFNDHPAQASRPLSASACGFVPASGAGILMLETLDSARERGARIYAEVVGGHVNCGGQRNGGSTTAPNPEGVVRCIQGALKAADLSPDDVDVVNGHLTATMADPLEVRNWATVLQRDPARFPLINSTKSLIGHGLGAAGGMECVASVLQLSRGFVHGSANCEDLHPDLEPYAARIPHQTVESDARVLAKASFGFGDVNGCVLFRRWE